MTRVLLALLPVLLAAPLWLVGEATEAPAQTATLAPRPHLATTFTPKPTQLSGIATWFDAERNGQSAWYTRSGLEFYAAAGPELRELRPHQYRGRYRAIITSEATGRAVVVWVVDWCSCHGGGQERLIDLAPAVWAALDMPLGRGIMRVSVEPLD